MDSSLALLSLLLCRQNGCRAGKNKKLYLLMFLLVPVKNCPKLQLVGALLHHLLAKDSASTYDRKRVGDTRVGTFSSCLMCLHFFFAKV